jgi:hypothetical protein
VKGRLALCKSARRRARTLPSAVSIPFFEEVQERAGKNAHHLDAAVLERRLVVEMNDGVFSTATLALEVQAHRVVGAARWLPELQEPLRKQGRGQHSVLEHTGAQLVVERGVSRVREEADGANLESRIRIAGDQRPERRRERQGKTLLERRDSRRFTHRPHLPAHRAVSVGLPQPQFLWDLVRPHPWSWP